MIQPTLAQDRQVDLVLSEVARGYGGDFAKVANVLFPIVPVSLRAGRIIMFGPDDFVLLNTQRAPGENTKRLQFGYASLPYGLADHSLEGAVPRERMQEASKGPGIDLATMAIRRVQRIMDRERENQAAALARNPANYHADNVDAPTAGDKWSEGGSDPFTQVQDARLVVRSRTGVMPNVMEMPPTVLAKLQVHPAVLARLGNASIKIATLQMLELLFAMTIVIGEEVAYNPATQKFDDMWGTDVILAATTPKSLQEMGSPSFGYTYQLEDHPIVEPAYYDANSKTWYYPTTDAYQAQLVGPSSGFLIRNVIDL